MPYGHTCPRCAPLVGQASRDGERDSAGSAARVLRCVPAVACHALRPTLPARCLVPLRRPARLPAGGQQHGGCRSGPPGGSARGARGCRTGPARSGTRGGGSGCACGSRRCDHGGLHAPRRRRGALGPALPAAAGEQGQARFEVGPTWLAGLYWTASICPAEVRLAAMLMRTPVT